MEDPVEHIGGAALIHVQREDDRGHPHAHDEVMLFLPVRGRVRFLAGDHTFTCDEREAFCVLDGVLHEHEALEGRVEYLVAFLGAAPFRAALTSPPDAWTFPQTLLIREAAAQLCAEASAKDVYAAASASACVTLLTTAAARGARDGSGRLDPWRPLPAEPGLARAMTYAREHHTEFPSVTELARQAAMSRRTLERAFQRTLGVSPRQYMEALRMHEARRRLMAGTESVTEIAFEVGYKDLSHFIRAYTNVYGHAPTQTIRAW